ncbi:MAG: hypothetical protein QOC81_241, partial [Thermoanaerobaculia bacterium]|nr:hypothetical protein [Thermoanaerobaculia bacterium]
RTRVYVFSHTHFYICVASSTEG